MKYSEAEANNKTQSITNTNSMLKPQYDCNAQTSKY